ASTGEETSAGGTTGDGVDGSTGDEATWGSRTGLPVPPRDGRRPLQHGDGRSGPGAGAAAAAPARPARHRRRLALIAAGRAGAAGALGSCGIIVGTLLVGAGSGAKGTRATVGVLFPPPGPPPSAFPSAPGGSPQIVMLQPFGDPATVFLIHGTGWAPRSRV